MSEETQGSQSDVNVNQTFDQFQNQKRKRERPIEICCGCGKPKPIYTHLDGDKSQPLCQVCNMRQRRESPEAVQTKLLKLSASAIGAVQSMLGLPVEEQRTTLQEMSNNLKIMVRVWLGGEPDQQADAIAPEEIVTPNDGYAQERKEAVSANADGFFATRVAPQIVGDPLPEPDPGTPEELRQQIQRMADVTDIEAALKQHFAELAQLLLADHPWSPTMQIFSLFVGRSIEKRQGHEKRLGRGDWVELVGRDDRLDKQLGVTPSLGRVVGWNVYGDAPRMRWCVLDGELRPSQSLWSRCLDLHDTKVVRVLFDWQAREKYPTEFSTFPKEYEPDLDEVPPEVKRRP